MPKGKGYSIKGKMAKMRAAPRHMGSKKSTYGRKGMGRSRKGK